MEVVRTRSDMEDIIAGLFFDCESDLPADVKLEKFRLLFDVCDRQLQYVESCYEFLIFRREIRSEFVSCVSELSLNLGDFNKVILLERFFHRAILDCVAQRVNLKKVIDYASCNIRLLEGLGCE